MSLTLSTGRSVAVRASRWWVAWLLVAVVLLPFADMAMPGLRFRFGILITDAAAAGMAVVAVLLWWVAPRHGTWSRMTQVFLAGLILLWVLVFALTVMRGDIVRYSVAVFPLLVAMVWIKRPAHRDLKSAATVFVLVLAGSAFVYLVLQVSGVVLDTWRPADGSDPEWGRLALAFEGRHYWLPLSWLPGIEWRWAGPYGHPNMAGAVGVVLAVFALAIPDWRRWAVGAMGVLVLLLVGSRTAFIATALGLAVLLAGHVLGGRTEETDGGRRRLGTGQLVAVGVAGVVAVGFAVSTVALNSDLTGRTGIWPQYLRLWRDSPWTGVGLEGIGDAQRAGLLPNWASTAHNVLLEALVRDGLVAGLLVLGIGVLALVIGLRGVVRDRRGAVGLAWVVAVMIGGVTTEIVDWLWLGPSTVAFVVGVLLTESDREVAWSTPDR